MTFCARRNLLTAMLLVAAAAFGALGVWQLERRTWKLGLIAAVAERVSAPARPAPGPAAWPFLSAGSDAYRHIVARGSWPSATPALVQAVTARGGGFWVMQPLRTDAGWTLLVNRGFVPAARSAPWRVRMAEHPVMVAGLLRISEPRGGFLRTNDPAADRWYSRDVARIAQARGWRNVAPYFLDADATPNAGGFPVGGLTIVSFRNAHLGYAVTWFALAAMSIFGVVLVRRSTDDQRRD